MGRPQRKAFTPIKGNRPLADRHNDPAAENAQSSKKKKRKRKQTTNAATSLSQASQQSSSTSSSVTTTTTTSSRNNGSSRGLPVLDDRDGHFLTKQVLQEMENWTTTAPATTTTKAVPKKAPVQRAANAVTTAATSLENKLAQAFSRARRAACAAVDDDKTPKISNLMMMTMTNQNLTADEDETPKISNVTTTHRQDESSSQKTPVEQQHATIRANQSPPSSAALLHENDTDEMFRGENVTVTTLHPQDASALQTPVEQRTTVRAKNQAPPASAALLHQNGTDETFCYKKNDLEPRDPQAMVARPRVIASKSMETLERVLQNNSGGTDQQRADSSSNVQAQPREEKQQEGEPTPVLRSNDVEALEAAVADAPKKKKQAKKKIIKSLKVSSRERLGTIQEEEEVVEETGSSSPTKSPSAENPPSHLLPSAAALSSAETSLPAAKETNTTLRQDNWKECVEVSAIPSNTSTDAGRAHAAGKLLVGRASSWTLCDQATPLLQKVNEPDKQLTQGSKADCGKLPRAEADFYKVFAGFTPAVRGHKRARLPTEPMVPSAREEHGQSKPTQFFPCGSSGAQKMSAAGEPQEKPLPPAITDIRATVCVDGPQKSVAGVRRAITISREREAAVATPMAYLKSDGEQDNPLPATSNHANQVHAAGEAECSKQVPGKCKPVPPPEPSKDASGTQNAAVGGSLKPEPTATNAESSSTGAALAGRMSAPKRTSNGGGSVLPEKLAPKCTGKSPLAARLPFKNDGADLVRRLSRSETRGSHQRQKEGESRSGAKSAESLPRSAANEASAMHFELNPLPCHGYIDTDALGAAGEKRKRRSENTPKNRSRLRTATCPLSAPALLGRPLDPDTERPSGEKTPTFGTLKTSTMSKTYPPTNIAKREMIKRIVLGKPSTLEALEAPPAPISRRPISRKLLKKYLSAPPDDPVVMEAMLGRKPNMGKTNFASLSDWSSTEDFCGLLHPSPVEEVTLVVRSAETGQVDDDDMSEVTLDPAYRDHARKKRSKDSSRKTAPSSFTASQFITPRTSQNEADTSQADVASPPHFGQIGVSAATMGEQLQENLESRTAPQHEGLLTCHNSRPSQEKAVAPSADRVPPVATQKTQAVADLGVSGSISAKGAVDTVRAADQGPSDAEVAAETNRYITPHTSIAGTTSNHAGAFPCVNSLDSSRQMCSGLEHDTKTAALEAARDIRVGSPEDPIVCEEEFDMAYEQPHDAGRSGPLRSTRVNSNAELWTADRAGYRHIVPVFRLQDGRLYRHPPLPPGWRLGISRSANVPYYYHSDIGQSTYYAPICLPLADGTLPCRTEFVQLVASPPKAFAPNPLNDTAAGSPEVPLAVSRSMGSVTLPSEEGKLNDAFPAQNPSLRSAESGGSPIEDENMSNNVPPQTPALQSKEGEENNSYLHPPNGLQAKPGKLGEYSSTPISLSAPASEDLIDIPQDVEALVESSSVACLRSACSRSSVLLNVSSEHFPGDQSDLKEEAQSGAQPSSSVALSRESFQLGSQNGSTTSVDHSRAPPEPRSPIEAHNTKSEICEKAVVVKCASRKPDPSGLVVSAGALSPSTSRGSVSSMTSATHSAGNRDCEEWSGVALKDDRGEEVAYAFQAEATSSYSNHLVVQMLDSKRNGGNAGMDGFKTPIDSPGNSHGVGYEDSDTWRPRKSPGDSRASSESKGHDDSGHVGTTLHADEDNSTTPFSRENCNDDVDDELDFPLVDNDDDDVPEELEESADGFTTVNDDDEAQEAFDNESGADDSERRDATSTENESEHESPSSVPGTGKENDRMGGIDEDNVAASHEEDVEDSPDFEVSFMLRNGNRSPPFSGPFSVNANKFPCRRSRDAMDDCRDSLAFHVNSHLTPIVHNVTERNCADSWHDDDVSSMSSDARSVSSTTDNASVSSQISYVSVRARFPPMPLDALQDVEACEAWRPRKRQKKGKNAKKATRHKPMPRTISTSKSLSGKRQSRRGW